MLKECGDKCFLDPINTKYPICPYDIDKNKPICDISCSGLLSAYIRSRQWKHYNISEKSKNLLETNCKKSEKSKNMKK